MNIQHDDDLESPSSINNTKMKSINPDTNAIGANDITTED
jgi:hypothetical protein